LTILQVQARDAEVYVAGGKDGGSTGALEGGGDGSLGRWTVAETRWAEVAAPDEVAVGRVTVDVRRGAPYSHCGLLVKVLVLTRVGSL